MDDTLEHADEEADQPPAAIEEFTNALTLLCNVLRNSELVDDLELKTELLAQAVRIWSSLAVISAVLTEEEEHSAS